MKAPAQTESQSDALKDYVVRVNRTAKVVKGGRRFGFSALVVMGNQNGKIGMGFGKANEVNIAVEKAKNRAKKSLATIARAKDTIPHQTIGECGASKIVMMPAAPGTGVIAGASVRAVIEAAGIKDILTKAYGSTNSVNLTKAALEGLKSLRTKEEVLALRGIQRK